MTTIFADQKAFEPSEDGQILTGPLLESSKGVLKIIECFGRAFSPVYSDVEGNIKKVEKHFVEDTEGCKTLEALLQKDKEAGQQKTDKGSTVGALWLKRGLEFMSDYFFWLLKDHNEKLNETSKNILHKAYEAHLKKHHGLISKAAFTAAAQFVPHKDDIILNLANKNKDLLVKVMEDMENYNKVLLQVLAAFNTLLIKEGIEKE